MGEASPKVKFFLALHNHQPVGNFEEVFEEAYQKAYRPFAEVLLDHPAIKWNLHCTGILWEFLERRHPEYLRWVKAMLKRGQIEILSGGFYEPILPVIPDADQAGQIKKLTGYLKKKFGVAAEGAWCAERVWEPHLPTVLAKAGIRYTVLDDSHFLSAGLKPDELKGHFRVEDRTDGVDVFPISEDLRYSIPFQPIEKTMGHFKKLAEKNEASAAVMADDGEKFGLWPGTYESVYGEKWLEKFLKTLEENQSWISTGLFSQHRKNHAPAGRVYLPAASYSAMSEWSGGTWRNFLAKYPESNAMYKKMLWVSKKVHASGKNQKALDRLWAGQCNCAYWHGVFGGLYLPVLRQAIYKHLIEAEKILDGRRDKRGSPARILAFDFDGDGRDEILFESPAQNIYVAPDQGGTIIEWDVKPASHNIVSVMARRPEPYHAKLKETGSLFYDRHNRNSMLDHFFHPKTTLETFRQCRYEEQGDFAAGEYARVPAASPSFALMRRGTVRINEQKHEIEVRKTWTPKISLKNGEAGLQVSYDISNRSAKTAETLWFGIEFNWAFSLPDASQDEPFLGLTRWERTDPHLHWKLAVDFDRKTDGWLFPIETVSSSVEKIETVFQGLCFAPHWKFALKPNETFTVKLQFAILPVEGAIAS